MQASSISIEVKLVSPHRFAEGRNSSLPQHARAHVTHSREHSHPNHTRAHQRPTLTQVRGSRGSRRVVERAGRSLSSPSPFATRSRAAAPRPQAIHTSDRKLPSAEGKRFVRGNRKLAMRMVRVRLQRRTGSVGCTGRQRGCPWGAEGNRLRWGKGTTGGSSMTSFLRSCCRYLRSSPAHTPMEM